MNTSVKILIIDDDTRNIFALTATLKAKGFTCLSALDAKEGKRLLIEHPNISIVLIDMMMPDMDGYEAMPYLRATTGFKDIPIIAVTAQAMLGDKEKCLAAGASDYVSKPIDVDKLMQVLEKVYFVMIADENIDLLLNDIVELYGYDFTLYTKASIKRRLNRLYTLDAFPSFAEFRHRIRNDKNYLQRFIEEITVNVTEMFRDPHFYQTLRNEILPMLATNPHIKIWHAGCSTGEEVFSMTILLKELNLLHKSIIYATDINPKVLEKMASGIFPLSYMKQYSENYIAAGGIKDFSTYYSANYDKAILDGELIQKVVQSTHNLVSDGSFNEFNLILCRNVLIYFDKPLQDRVFNLFDDSLARLGYLCLGSKETLKFSDITSRYQQHKKEKIWKKIK